MGSYSLELIFELKSVSSSNRIQQELLSHLGISQSATASSYTVITHSKKAVLIVYEKWIPQNLNTTYLRYGSIVVSQKKTSCFQGVSIKPKKPQHFSIYCDWSEFEEGIRINILHT